MHETCWNHSGFAERVGDRVCSERVGGEHLGLSQDAFARFQNWNKHGMRTIAEAKAIWTTHRCGTFLFLVFVREDMSHQCFILRTPGE